MSDSHEPDEGAPMRPMDGDLPCTVCLDGLHRFVEGEADPALARAIAAHLRRCAGCVDRRRRLEEERIGFLEGAIRSPALSPRFAARVVEEIERRDRETSVLGRLGRWRSIGIASAAAVAVTAVFFIAPSRETPSARPVVRSPIEAMAVSSNGSPSGALPTLVREDAAPKEDARVDAERVVSVVHSAAALPASMAPPANPIALADSIEVLSSVLRVDARLPCSDDVNRDGESDLSDAAHFFMLAVASTPAGIGSLSPAADMDLDCILACTMQARL